jgi:phospholipase C
MTIDRRDFIKGAVGASGALVLGSTLAGKGWAEPLRHAAERHRLPRPGNCGIEHIVLVMMENRSFDHILGWLPHADGRQQGLSYQTPDGKKMRTYHQKQLNGCNFADPDHSYLGGRIQYNNGRMDGFLTDTNNDSFAISYYTESQRPFMGSLARQYTACDRYHCAILGPTFPNRVFQHAGQTDRLSNTFTVSTLPTIWDRLNQTGGPTGRYYYSDLPITALWGSKYNAISSPLAKFMSDAAAGTLPNVSFVDPGFIGEGTATSNDDHPANDLRAGDYFLSQIFHALASGPGWDKTVFIINYDEWGGFFDHVAPARITPGIPKGSNPHDGIDKDLDKHNRVLSGFRVPCIISGPFARHGRKGFVSHDFYDHTSVLKLIEWRWGLSPLSERDASRSPHDPQNLALALNFESPDARVPSLPKLAPFVPTGCTAPSAALAQSAPNQIPVRDISGKEDWVGFQRSGLLQHWG